MCSRIMDPSFIRDHQVVDERRNEMVCCVDSRFLGAGDKASQIDVFFYVAQIRRKAQTHHGNDTRRDGDEPSGYLAVYFSNLTSFEQS